MRILICGNGKSGNALIATNQVCISFLIFENEAVVHWLKASNHDFSVPMNTVVHVVVLLFSTSTFKVTSQTLWFSQASCFLLSICISRFCTVRFQDSSVDQILLKSIQSIATMELFEKIVVDKVLCLISLVTKRGGLLTNLYCTQCPIFSTKARTDLNYHFANKHRAPKPSSVVFVTNSFQALMLYDKINTVNMAFLTKQQLLILTISSMKLLIRVVFMSTFPREF